MLSIRGNLKNIMSHTPNFNKAIEEILKNLKPHSRKCFNCQKDFHVENKDIEFYKVFQVPPSKLCHSCKLQNILAYRISFLPIFHRRPCNVPEHTEDILSFYHKSNPVKVYDDKYYNLDNWDGLEFGVDYNPQESFFNQFHKFVLNVPHQSLNKDPQSVNCEYVVSGVMSKNCYYVAVPYKSENVYHSFLPFLSNNCVDINEITSSENCYECANLDHCYNCQYVYDSTNCIDSYFLFDCKNCSNCFLCTNLRNKQYCILNKQYTKEEYERKMKEIDLGSRQQMQKYQQEFEKLLKQAIYRNINNIKAENCIGNDIKNSKDCYMSFRSLGDSENLRYCNSFHTIKDTMDFHGGAGSQLVYHSTGIINASNIKFSIVIRTGLDLEYCIECSNCEHCFACFGLKNKKYCIFNKQYSESEYWHKVDKIKTQMLKNEEYGEFFPVKKSPFPYNETSASIEFPLSKEEILSKEWYYLEAEDEIDISKYEVLTPNQIPDNIKDVDNSILDKVLICSQTQRPFKLTKFELNFYKKHHIPIPNIHPLQRIKNRFIKWRHPYKLWKDKCQKCHNNMYSNYNPKRGLKVYCEKCYQQEVI